MTKRIIRELGVGAVVLSLAGAASAGEGQGAATTKLRRCGNETCLSISGRRADPAMPVFIERHPVAVAGGRRWRVVLPLRTMRDWSKPFARSIVIGIGDREARTAQAALPIGVFGHTTDLASLDVTAPRRAFDR